MRAVVLLLAALLRFAAGAHSGAEAPAGWPQWGGPLRNGTAPDKGVFSDGPFRLRELWRRPVGEGISALTTAGGRLFFLSAEGEGRFAFALDAGTGKELWRVALATTPPTLEFGPASTPATDGRLVFFLSPACQLMALAVEDGKTIWQHDLKKEYNPGPMASGCWTSPLLEGKLLVVDVDGEPDKRVMAFDKTTGAVLWSAAGTVRVPPRTSPTIADVAGVRQVLVHDATDEDGGGLLGLRLSDGILLWSTRFKVLNSYSFDMPIPLPGDRIGVVTWSDFRVLAVRKPGSAPGADLLWSTHDVRAELQPFTLHAVYHDGQIYGIGGDYLSCLDLATGKTVWKEKVYRSALILVDGHLVLLPQATGVLRVVEATPAGYREKARAAVFNPGAPTDTPPSFAGRRIYLRNSEQIVALEVVRDGG